MGQKLASDITGRMISIAGKTYFKNIIQSTRYIKSTSIGFGAQTMWAEKGIRDEVASLFQVAK